MHAFSVAAFVGMPRASAVRFDHAIEQRSAALGRSQLVRRARNHPAADELRRDRLDAGERTAARIGFGPYAALKSFSGLDPSQFLKTSMKPGMVCVRFQSR